MGALVSSSQTDFGYRLQTYFNPKLLEALTYELHLAEYGLRGKYPAHGTSIRFFRPRAASAANVAVINAEGAGATHPGTSGLTEVAVGYIDVPLSQRGALAKVTDIVQAIDLLNTVALYVKTMAADAALDLDTVIRNALIVGLSDSNVKFGAWRFERFAGVTNTVDSSDDFATHLALNQSQGKITRLAHIGCVTQLKAAKVPTINGKYVAIVSPQVVHDMRQDTTWVSGAVYDVGTLWKRAAMMLDGCVFVESMNPWIENDTYATYGATDTGTAGLIYSTFYLGEGAFGVPELANDKAGSNPYGPKLMILAQPDKADPLNLVVTIGWKAYWGCKPLIATTDGSTPATGEVPRYVILRSKSTFA